MSSINAACHKAIDALFTEIDRTINKLATYYHRGPRRINVDIRTINGDTIVSASTSIQVGLESAVKVEPIPVAE